MVEQTQSTVIQIAEVTELDEVCEGLVELLRDSVTGGASVGFLPPISDAEATDYWRSVEDELPGGNRRLLVATIEGRLVGAVQLALCAKINGMHRAEVEKLMVHSSQRGAGIARQLMGAVEQTAVQSRRTLLVLDTRLGDVAEQLYRKLGYREAGRIPAFARGASGELEATCLFYKQLNAAAETAEMTA